MADKTARKKNKFLRVILDSAVANTMVILLPQQDMVAVYRI